MYSRTVRFTVRRLRPALEGFLPRRRRPQIARERKRQRVSDVPDQFVSFAYARRASGNTSALRERCAKHTVRQSPRDAPRGSPAMNERPWTVGSGLPSDVLAGEVEQGRREIPRD